MTIKYFISQELKYMGEFGFQLSSLIHWLYQKIQTRGGIVATIERKYKNTFHRPIDWNNPQTMNEKIQWLKFNAFEPFHTVCADKYRVREYLDERIGKGVGQIPILYKTDDWKDITIDILPDEPFVVKANHTQGDVWIFRDKSEVDIKRLRTACRWALKRNIYPVTGEQQYKDVKPLIIIEKLLLKSNGQIPNDYKLHFFNGKLELVYCSVDREGANKRNTYDADWNPIIMAWSGPYVDPIESRGPEIPAPISFNKMKEYGELIAKDFNYVRVDYYDVDGELYFGEITMHHGSGFDVFVPEKYDLIFGQKLKLK